MLKLVDLVKKNLD